MSKFKLGIDVNKESYSLIKCKQNDDLSLEVSVYEDGSIKNLANAVISVQAKKPNNTFIIQTEKITKSNNIFNIDLIKDFTRASGTVLIEIVIVENQKQKTTSNIILDIASSVISDAVESDNTVTILENLENKIVEANLVKAETEHLITSGGAATKGDLQQVNSQLEQNKQQLAFKDFYTPISNISPKLVYNTNGVIFVVAKKPNGKGFIRFKLREGVFTTTESIGSPAELLRVMEVYNIPKVSLYKKAESSNSDSTVWEEKSISYPLSENGAYSNVLCKAMNTKVANSWIEYSVTVPEGVNKITALIYGSSGSSGNVNISIDGSNVLTGQSFTKSTAQWFTLDIPITSGTHTVRFTTITSAFMTIGGVNYQEFLNYNDKLFFDTPLVFFEGSKNAYVTADGAMDYALYDSDIQKWCGSYHGGETRNRILMLLDNLPITLNNGELKIGNILEIEQDTNINNKINAYSRHIFKQDGAIEFEVIFNGNINLTKMFTNMSTTSDLYNDILYPIRKTLQSSDTGNHMIPSGVNYIIQRDSTNNQKAITILNNNMYPNDRVPVPFIKKTPGAYNKVYNANIDSTEPVNFKGGNFRTIHIFE